MVTGGPLSSRPGVALAAQPFRGDLGRRGARRPRSPSAAAATISSWPPPPPASGATTASSGSRPPSCAWPRRPASAAATRSAATGSRRPASRCRPPSGGRDRSSASSSSGWRRRGGSRRCRSRRRVAATLGRLPTRLLLPALHAQADSVDFAATALPGLRGARHICGSLIEASYPLGPRLGCPMNITAFGNDDRLDVGIALDPAALDAARPPRRVPDRRVRQLRHDGGERHRRQSRSDAVVARRQRGRRRRQRRGLLDSLLDGATEIVQSVANEVAPGVVGAHRRRPGRPAGRRPGDRRQGRHRGRRRAGRRRGDRRQGRRPGGRRQGRHRRRHGPGRPAGAARRAST